MFQRVTPYHEIVRWVTIGNTLIVITIIEKQEYFGASII